MKKIFSVIKNEASAGALLQKYPEEDFFVGSQLIVGEAEEALFVKNGVVTESFTGGRYTLTTENFPFISALKNKMSGGSSPFNCKIYFINKSHKLELFWGTDSPMQVRDPEFGFMVGVRARGSYSITIADGKKFFLKLAGNGAEYYTADDVDFYFRSPFIMNVKAHLARVMRDLKFTILDIAPELDNIALEIKPKMQAVLDEYGVTLVNFYIVDVSIPESDPNYEKINRAYADKGTMSIQGAAWDKFTAKEILKDAAANTGTVGLGAGLGLGLGALGAIGNMGAGTLGGINTVENKRSKFCPECGAENAENAKFCAQCGFKFAKGCPLCGARAAEGAKFCPECGGKL